MLRWLLLLGVVIESAVIIFINYYDYAGVMPMRIFGSLLVIQFLCVIYGLITKSLMLFNTGLLIIITVFFIFARPNYTYDEAIRLATAEFANDTKEDHIPLVSLNNKTVPAQESTIWSLNKNVYYVAIQRSSSTHFHYIIDPVDGTVSKIDEPYWW